MTLTKEVVAVQWEESERDWGVRPDGFSLHVSLDEAKDYQKEHWARMNKTYGDISPDEYDRPTDGFFMVKVTDEIFDRVQKEKSVRLFKVSKEEVQFSRRV